MKALAQTLAALALSVMAQVAAAQQLLGSYNPTTGNIKIDPLKQVPWALYVRAPASELIPGNALRAGTNGIDTAFSGEIAYLSFSGFQATFDAGNIIKPGTPPSHVSGSWWRFQWDEGPIIFSEVPEPGSLALTVAGLVLMTARRSHT